MMDQTPLPFLLFVLDLGERHDLATRNKAKRDEMPTDLFGWMRRADALLPSEKYPAYALAADADVDGAKGRRGKKKQGAGK
jgi:hypothetical protein